MVCALRLCQLPPFLSHQCSKVQVGPLGSAAAWPRKLLPSSSMFHICIDSCPQLENFTGNCVPFHLLLSGCVEQKRAAERGGQHGSYAVSPVVELSI